MLSSTLSVDLSLSPTHHYKLQLTELVTATNCILLSTMREDELVTVTVLL